MKEKQGHKNVIYRFQIEIITNPRVKTCINTKENFALYERS